VDKVVRGRSLNTVVALADYLLALMVPKNVLPEASSEQKAEANPFRHAFWVSQERFDEVTEELNARGVPFEGPVTHPERGPLGQSIYLADPAGNSLEICWRRDRARAFHPVTTAGRLAEH
jgi:catechol-2,3-dioxygenase